MKRWLISIVLCSAPAFAQAPATDDTLGQPTASADGPGNGLQLELNVLGASTLGGITTIFGAGGTGAGVGLLSLPVGTTAAVGYQANQNAFLLGIGFVATSGTNIGFGLSPTYRRYLQPLKTGAVTPFAQGTIGFAIVAPSGGSSAFLFGIGGGGGAEWLFTKNIGIIIDAELEYAHLNTGPNIDTIGVVGNIGMTVHF